jgi:hypothetical protein
MRQNSFKLNILMINFCSLFHRAFWFTKFFHTNSHIFTYNYVSVF